MMGASADANLSEEVVSRVSLWYRRASPVCRRLSEQAVRCSSWCLSSFSKQLGVSSIVATTAATTPNTQRLVFLDSLRGILAVVVILHHAQCMFDPCRVFGPSAAMIKDISECDELDTTFQVLWNPWTNGTFCAFLFFVMSGMVLSHGLWKAHADTWRLAVAKRFFRLFLCCCGAMMFARVLTSFSEAHNDVVNITKSIWLERVFFSILPTRLMDLPGIVLGSMLNGTSSFGGTMWAMSIELSGSYLTFGLVLLLKASPHRIRTRWLAALFLALLVPSVTIVDNLETRVGYGVMTSPNAKRGARADIRRTISMNTNDHLYLLDQLGKPQRRQGVSPNTVLKMKFTDSSRDHWHKPVSKAEQEFSYVLDGVNGDVESLLDNAALRNELLASVDSSYDMIIDPTVEMVKESVWTTENQWLVFAAFVAGAWISEMHLSTSGVRTDHESQKGSIRMVVSWILPIFSFLCASYPHGNVSTAQVGLWSGMKQVASLLGYTGESVLLLWCTLGAVSFASYLVFFATFLREILVHPVLRELGRLSLSLYLTHIPILYTLTCSLFAMFYGWFDEDTTWSSVLALSLSIPVMGAFALIFHRLVDEPSQKCSHYFAVLLLGMVDHTEGGHIKSAEIDKPQLIDDCNNT